MTLIQVIDAARQIVKDELDSARTFPNNSSSFFTDSEMTTWFNLTQKEVQNKLIQTFENFFVTSTSIDIVANQEEYSMPIDHVKIIRVEDIQNTSAPIEVYPISFNDKERYTPIFNTNITALGYVHGYSIKGNSFIFRPRPDRSINSGVRVYYSKQIPDYVSATSCSIIPDNFHEALMWGVIRRAYAKQESTPEALSMAEGNFNRLMKEMVNTAENRQVQRSRRVKRRKGYGKR